MDDYKISFSLSQLDFYVAIDRIIQIYKYQSYHHDQSVDITFDDLKNISNIDIYSIPKFQNEIIPIIDLLTQKGYNVTINSDPQIFISLNPTKSLTY